jgi:ATP-dependent Clp protease ATP-binding subunit ClpA
MRPLLNASEEEFMRLKRSATGKCLRFFNCDMPPGTRPSRAVVGLEVSAGGATTFYVQKGLSYEGRNAALREWFASGEKRLPSFGDFVNWIRLHLSPEYQSPPQRISSEALAQAIAQEVCGQEDAVTLLAETASRHLAKPRPRRPATLFFVGPTGVGKTQSALALTAAIERVDKEAGFLRLDMSEFQEGHRVSQLFGAPPGYIGYGDPSPLIETLSKHPRAVILFDEIEKAHPSVLLSLMNAMDAGRLSLAAPRANGRDIDCRQAIFVFTSNLRIDEILEEIDERQIGNQTDLIDELCRGQMSDAGLTPELVGRIQHFVLFRPLSRDARMETLRLSVTRVGAEYGLEISGVAPSVLLTLLRQAGDGEYGARTDEYLVDRVLGDCFAEATPLFGESPLELFGPPYRCAPFRGGHDECESAETPPRK